MSLWGDLKRRIGTPESDDDEAAYIGDETADILSDIHSELSATYERDQSDLFPLPSRIAAGYLMDNHPIVRASACSEWENEQLNPNHVAPRRSLDRRLPATCTNHQRGQRVCSRHRRLVDEILHFTGLPVFFPDPLSGGNSAEMGDSLARGSPARS